MKKSELSYKNLNVRPESANRQQQIPAQAKLTIIDHKIEKVSKEIQLINARKQLKQFNSAKQNDPKVVNRFSTQGGGSCQDSLRPRRQFKLYTQCSQPPEPCQNLRIQRLQLQLRKKLCQNGFLSFFKTANTSQMSHIDIYLQLTDLQQLYNEKQKQVRELEKQLSDCHREVEELLVQREHAEEKFREHTEQVRQFTEIIDRMQEKSGEGEREKARKLEEVEGKYEELRGLFAEVDRQRGNLVKRVKDLEEDREVGRKKGAKELEDQRIKFDSEISRLKSEITNLTQNLNQQKSHSNQLQQNNNELHLQIQTLTNELSQQTSNLQQQMQRTQQASDQLSRTNSDLRELQHNYNTLQQKLSSDIEQLKSQLESEQQKKSQLKFLVNEHMSKQKKYEERIGELGREVERQGRGLESQAQEFGKVKRDNARLVESERALKQALVGMEYDNKSIRQDRKKLQDLVARLQSDLTRLSNSPPNKPQPPCQQTTLLKLQKLHEKKQSNQRYRTVGKLRQITARLNLYLQHPPSTPTTTNTTKQSDELQHSISQLSSTVSNLVTLFIQPLTKQVETLALELKTLEMERECCQENRGLEMQTKEEIIQLLMKFVPDEAGRAVHRYVSVLQEQDGTSQAVNRKLSLLQSVLKQAEKCKKPIQPLHPQPQYLQPPPKQQQPTSRRSSEQKPIARDRSLILRKYFN